MMHNNSLHNQGAGNSIRPSGPILFALFLSGMSALIYEVSWIRPITSVLQSTVYVVSLILTAFMLGLALGSLCAKLFIEKVERPLLLYTILEFGIAAYGLLLLSLFSLLPKLLQAVTQIKTPLLYFFVEFSCIFLLLLIPTTLMGATFPILAKSYVGNAVGKSIGELYATNNLGAVTGSLLAGFILLPNLGVRYTIILAALLNIAAGSLILAHYHRDKLKYFAAPALVGFMSLSYCGNYSLANLYNGGVCGYFQRNYLGDQQILFYEEGSYGYVTVIGQGQFGAVKRLLLNGQGSSSLRLSDVRVSTLLGYLPVLANPSAQTSLTIGFGTGASSSILSRHTITTTVEIEPKVIETAGFFEMINAGVFNNNHKIVFDDARHYLLRTPKKYDLIINHPLELYQSFSSLLFTKEFLELAKSRLNENGLYFQWFPLYDLKPEEFQDFYKTFDSVFPHQMVFVNIKAGENINYEIKGAQNVQSQYLAKQNSNELIIIGSAKPIPLDLAALRESFARLQPVDRNYLKLTSLDSPEAIFNLLLFKGEELRGYYEDGTIITDDKPSLEFSTPFRLVEKSPQLVNQAMDAVLNYIKLSQD